MTRGQCDARPTVTFPAARHHRPVGWYQIILLCSRGTCVLTICPGLYWTVEIRTRDVLTASPAPYRYATQLHIKNVAGGGQKFTPMCGISIVLSHTDSLSTLKISCQSVNNVMSYPFRRPQRNKLIAIIGHSPPSLHIQLEQQVRKSRPCSTRQRRRELISLF